MASLRLSSVTLAHRAQRRKRKRKHISHGIGVAEFLIITILLSASASSAFKNSTYRSWRTESSWCVQRTASRGEEERREGRKKEIQLKWYYRDSECSIKPKSVGQESNSIQMDIVTRSGASIWAMRQVQDGSQAQARRTLTP
ncbi:uncharacterized protein LOC118153004 [Callithrix jacchus]